MTTTVTEKPQHLRALERANETRWHHADQLRQLALLNVSLEELLLDERMGTVTIGRLMRALPTKPGCATEGYARHKYAARILGRINLAADRRVKTLSDLSRKKLLDAAWDYTGQVAWIFAADPRPRPVKRSSRPKAPREASMKALEAANLARREDKAIKDALEAGEMTLREALELPRVENWQIGQLVRHLRRTTKSGEAWLASLAPTAARQELRRARLAPQTRVRAMSKGRREDLIARFTLARFCQPGTTVEEVTS